MELDWEHPIKHTHPNVFLRIYGNTMMMIADFFLKRGLKYSDSFEIPSLDDEFEDYVDFEDLEFEYSMWSPKRHV
jgi:hypothetical protein